MPVVVILIRTGQISLPRENFYAESARDECVMVTEFRVVCCGSAAHTRTKKRSVECKMNICKFWLVCLFLCNFLTFTDYFEDRQL